MAHRLVLTPEAALEGVADLDVVRACWPRRRCRAERTTMHLARRAYVLVILTAVLAIVGHLVERARAGAPVAACRRRCCCSAWPSRACWSGARLLAAQVDTAARAFLGRPQPAAFELHQPVPRRAGARVRPGDALPASSPLAERAPRGGRRPRHGGRCSDAACRCGSGRSAGRRCRRACWDRFALAWWSTALQPQRELWWHPMRCARGATLRGLAGGARARRVAGAGAELHQLRDYVPGRPARAHRLEGDRAHRRAGDARVQRGPAPGRAGRHRCRAPQPRALRRARSLRPVQQRRGAPRRDRHAP